MIESVVIFFVGWLLGVLTVVLLSRKRRRALRSSVTGGYDTSVDVDGGDVDGDYDSPYRGYEH